MIPKKSVKKSALKTCIYANTSPLITYILKLYSSQAYLEKSLPMFNSVITHFPRLKLTFIKMLNLQENAAMKQCLSVYFIIQLIDSWKY